MIYSLYIDECHWDLFLVIFIYNLKCTIVPLCWGRVENKNKALLLLVIKGEGSSTK